MVFEKEVVEMLIVVIFDLTKPKFLIRKMLRIKHIGHMGRFK